MRFAVWPDTDRPWHEIKALALHCDATGWDGLYLSDHLMAKTTAASSPGGPNLECWAALAALASVTRRVRLGSLVSPTTFRHPAILANAAVTIDHICGGRFVLGLGAGWQANEHHAYGFALGDASSRFDRLAEACQVVQQLLSRERTSFNGQYFHIADAPCEPKPVAAHLPLLIGGTGEQRLLPIVARFADQWNGWCSPDSFRSKREVLNRLCERVGRDPAAISVSAPVHLAISNDEKWVSVQRSMPAKRPRLIGSPSEIIEQVAKYREAGVSELVVSDRGMGGLQQRQDCCDMFISEVATVLE